MGIYCNRKLARNSFMQRTVIIFLLLIFAVASLYSCKDKVIERTKLGVKLEQVAIQNKSSAFRILQRGTVFETPLFKYEGENRGPAILIIGGTHGNEPAGYESALRLMQALDGKPIDAGTVLLLPLANIKAVEKYSRRVPVEKGVDKERGNLNRCYPGKPDGYPMEKLAWEITQIAREFEIKVFFDLHEARHFHLESDWEDGDQSLGQTLIYAANEASAELVIELLDAINEIVVPRQQFSAIERPIYSSASWWAGKELGIAAFTFETTRIKIPLEDRIKQQVLLVNTALQYYEIYSE